MKNFGKIVIAGALSLAIVAGGSIIGGYYLGNNSSAQSISDAERNGFNEGYNQGSSVADKEKELLWQRLEKQFKEKQQEMESQHQKETEEMQAEMQAQENMLKKVLKKGSTVLWVGDTLVVITSDSERFVYSETEGKFFDLDGDSLILEGDSFKICKSQDKIAFLCTVDGAEKVICYKDVENELQEEYTISDAGISTFSFCTDGTKDYYLINNNALKVYSNKEQEKQVAVTGASEANVITCLSDMESTSWIFTWTYDFQSQTYAPLVAIYPTTEIQKSMSDIGFFQNTKISYMSKLYLVGYDYSKGFICAVEGTGIAFIFQENYFAENCLEGNSGGLLVYWVRQTDGEVWTVEYPRYRFDFKF